MNRSHNSAVALAFCAALLGAACGSSAPSDLATNADTSAPTSTVALDEAAPTTINEATTTIATTTTTSTVAPTTTSVAPTTVLPPPVTTAPPVPTTTPAPTVEYCDSTGPVPSDAVLMSSLTVDMLGDGSANDLVEAYDIGGAARLRIRTGEGVVSEIINPAVDGTYRPLGLAGVFPGDSAELFAVIGEGSAATEIGVFGLDFADCLFSYSWTGTSDDFTMLIRPGSRVRSDATCFAGGIALTNAEQQADGTWAISTAAYVLATPWTVEYMGGSDDFNDGLAEADLPAFEFDCFDLTL